jgi:Tfp pilus assembly protein PilF
MSSKGTDAAMPVRMWAAVAVLACLACGVGCRLPDFLRFGRPAETPVEESIPRLSKRQVANVQLSVAQSLEQKGEVNAALDAYQEVAAKSPHRATAYWRMAVLHDRLGNVQESEKLYRQALKAEPTNADIHCDFGYSLYLQRRWAEAEDQLRQTVALNAAHRRGHNNLGLLLAQTERLDEALTDFHYAGCPEAEARTNLAFVLTLNRRWDEARAQYQLALEANPSSLPAKAGLESLAGIMAKATPGAGDFTRIGYEAPISSSGR